MFALLARNAFKSHLKSNIRALHPAIGNHVIRITFSLKDSDPCSQAADNSIEDDHFELKKHFWLLPTESSTDQLLEGFFKVINRLCDCVSTLFPSYHHIGVVNEDHCNPSASVRVYAPRGVIADGNTAPLKKAWP
ncbi:hypothetical protein ABG067_000647 [Albugo candida]